ncbi:MAG: hypothetical protein KJ043_21290, partial [Anaerolineae bacterium]|nr:hypothetical protein [Anaerolineae bacterium]
SLAPRFWEILRIIFGDSPKNRSLENYYHLANLSFQIIAEVGGKVTQNLKYSCSFHKLRRKIHKNSAVLHEFFIKIVEVVIIVELWN